MGRLRTLNFAAAVAYVHQAHIDQLGGLKVALDVQLGRLGLTADGSKAAGVASGTLESGGNMRSLLQFVQDLDQGVLDGVPVEKAEELKGALVALHATVTARLAAGGGDVAALEAEAARQLADERAAAQAEQDREAARLAALAPAEEAVPEGRRRRRG